MEKVIELDASNRIVLNKALRQAAGITHLQKLKVTSTPGRIVIEAADKSVGDVAKRGSLKVWTGDVPATPIEEAVDQARRYTR